MSPAQAQAALKKLFGKAAAWRYDESALKGEEREALVAALPNLRQTREAAKAAMEARRDELLRDPEYVKLREAYQRASKEAEIAFSRSIHRRVTVGKCNGMFLSVVAEGDNWQEAIDNARAKLKS
jgi:hypothetical protein